MEIAQNKIRIDLRNNPKLKAHYSNMKDGEKSTIEIEFTKESMTDDAIVGSIESVAPQGYAETDAMTGKKDKEVEPSRDEPMVVEVFPGE